MTTRSDIIFIAEMSTRYHRRRAAFLSVAAKLLNLAVIITGAGAFVALTGDKTALAQFAALLTTAVGAVQIVFGIDTAAATHQQWLASWLKLLSEARRTMDPDAATVARWIEKRYEIEGECVGELRALQVDCFNRAADAMNLGGERQKLTRFQRMMIQVASFERSFG